MFEARLDQRERHARIAGFPPAEAHAFPEHPHDLGNVGIGIRIGRAAATTISSVSCASTSPCLRLAAMTASWMRSPAARSILASMPRSRP